MYIAFTYTFIFDILIGEMSLLLFELVYFLCYIAYIYILTCYFFYLS